MSVAKAGGAKLAAAGGAVSAAHSGGMRTGMQALSKGMKKAPKVDASGDGSKSPNWAKKVRSKQQRQHATRAASHAIRNSDRGGGGNGPSLNPDG